MEAYQRKIIDLFIEQELLIASLYELFSKRFLAHKDFWTAMVAEEREHASWVKHLLGGVEQDKILFSEGKIRTYTINSSITYIKGLINEFDKKPFNSHKAAIISLDLERALLEKNVFKCFEGDSNKVARILEILRDGQVNHIRKISKFADDIKEKV